VVVPFCKEFRQRIPVADDHIDQQRRDLGLVEAQDSVGRRQERLWAG